MSRISATTKGGTSAPIVPTSGVIDGANTVFVFSKPPVYLSSDGVNKFVTANYTLSVNTITFTDGSPPTTSLYAFV